MRLVTFEREGHRRLGAIVGAQVVDLPDAVGHPAFPSTMEALVAANRGTVMDAARDVLNRPAVVADSIVPEPRLLAPILPPSMPEEMHPWLADPGAELLLPPGDEEPTFEPGIAAVIFAPRKKLRRSQAGECIFGYTLVSYWRMADGGFAAAMGPWIVTADEFDPSVVVRVHVSGKLWSEGTIADAEASFGDMVYGAARDAALHPGEVFSSGPLGRRGKRNGRAPKAGSEIEVEAAGFGLLTHRLGPRVSRLEAS